MNQNHKGLIITGLLIGIIFSELDETVVNTALPTIIRQLHGLALYGWIIGVYMLAMTSFMPILGKLADLYGRKLVYLLSMGLFITGSIVSGFAAAMPVLLIGRGIQGIGAGGLMPLAMVIFGDTFTVEERAKIQGVFGAFMFIPQLVGPLIGGYFTQHMSWHWIFWVNIPVGVLAAFVLAAGLRESKGVSKAKIDWAGAFLLVASIVTLLLAPVLHENEGYAWNSSVLLALFTAGAILLGLFVLVESKAKEPILPLHLFRNRTFVVVSLIVFTLILGLMGVFSSFTFFTQNVFGLTPLESGYFNLPMMVGAVLASIVTGPLMTKLPYRYLFIVSLCLPVLGFYLMTGIGIHTRLIAVMGDLVILGLGFGVLFNNNLIIQESVPKSHNGIALSAVTLFQSIGMTIGVSIFGSVLASEIRTGVGTLAKQLPADAVTAIGKAAQGGIPKGLDPKLAEQVKMIFASAFQHLYWTAFVISIIAVAICWFLKHETLSSEAGKENGPESEAGNTGQKIENKPAVEQN